MSCATAVRGTSNVITTAAIGAGFGYLGTALFTSINPVTGAIFGAVHMTVDLIANAILNEAMNHSVAQADVRARKIVSFVIASGVTIGAMLLIGVKLSLATAAIILIAQVAAVVLSIFAVALLGAACRGCC